MRCVFKIIEKFIPETIRTPVARPVAQPTIQYLEKLIDFKCTPESIQWRQNSAETDFETNTIRIFIPVEVPDITSIPMAERLRPGDINKAPALLRTSYIPRALAHEMRHVRNCAYQEYMQPEKTRRYYDISILLGLNEVSAYAAEELAGIAGRTDRSNPEQITNMDDLWEAVDHGLWSALDSSYLAEYSNLVASQFIHYAWDLSPESQIKFAKKMIAQNPVKYCRSTKIIADYFLTFGDTHVLDKAVKMPPEIKEGFEEFRNTYEDMVRQTLQCRIDTLQDCINDLKR